MRALMTWLVRWFGGLLKGAPTSSATTSAGASRTRSPFALPVPPAVAPERQRAHDLIAAIDAGGLPLNPARVNHIARQLGLEVSGQARMEETIARIRKVLAS